jgi:hypothetical protein
VSGAWVVGLLALGVAFYAGIRTQQARQMFEDYQGYKARAAALRWLRWRLAGVAMWGWALMAIVATVLINVEGP